MNERIKQLAHEAGLPTYNPKGIPTKLEKFAELIVLECAGICMEMSAKCAGLEGEGALAEDCAYWIKKDFGVEE